MKDEELFNFYEKIYFHELELREKLNARLQTPLAILVVEVSFLAYIFTNSNADYYNGWAYSFIFLIIITTIIIGIAIGYLFKSFLNFTYKHLPSTKEINTYRDDLIKIYSPYEKSDDLVEKYTKQAIYNHFTEASSVNSQINEKRSHFIHRTNIFILAGIITSLLACIPYFFGNLNSKEDKPIKVIITNPIKIER